MNNANEEDIIQPIDCYVIGNNENTVDEWFRKEKEAREAIGLIQAKNPGNPFAGSLRVKARMEDGRILDLFRARESERRWRAN